jgi:hypothetical protein
MNKSALLLLSALAVGCGTQRYGFRPTAMSASAEGGYPASHYVVPPEAPRGEAYVTSFGTREVGAGGDAHAQLIHVRLAVSNQSDAAEWTVDPGQLLLIAARQAPQRPDFMEIDGRQNGNTEIARGQRRMFDIYYRMPGGAPDARGLPSFDFQWQINLGGKVVAERTTFAREPYRDYEEAGREYVAVGAVAPWWWGWYGPPWWGVYDWPYGRYGYGPYGYGPRVGIGVGVGVGGGGGYGPRYRPYGGGGGGRGRVAPPVRGR